MAAIRERFGLSQEAMGALCGTNRLTWWQWENGRRPAKGPVARLVRLLDALYRHNISIATSNTAPDEITIEFKQP